MGGFLWLVLYCLGVVSLAVWAGDDDEWKMLAFLIFTFVVGPLVFILLTV